MRAHRGGPAGGHAAGRPASRRVAAAVGGGRGRAGVRPGRSRAACSQRRLTMVGRFAPSPSGLMHLGNARTALLAWLDARARAGTMLLRIEDLDRDRCRPEYARAIRDDLAWLGLDWDAETRPQSLRGPDYAVALQRLGRGGGAGTRVFHPPGA